MIQHLAIRSGTEPHEVEVNALWMGEDLVACFGGGDTPHVGAVALGIPVPPDSGPNRPAASASVLCVTGHEEDQLARECAIRLATKLQSRVCVTVGFHMEGARPADRRKLVANQRAALESLERELDVLGAQSAAD